MGELEKLGYIRKQGSIFKNYIEWENKKEDIRISYDGRTIYIRKASERKPVSIYEKELMALLIDIGKAQIVK